MEIEEKVLLLAIMKRRKDESLSDVLMMLENSKVFTFKEGKRLLKKFKQQKLLFNDCLTPSGAIFAKEAETEFKL